MGQRIHRAETIAEISASHAFRLRSQSEPNQSMSRSSEPIRNTPMTPSAARVPYSFTAQFADDSSTEHSNAATNAQSAEMPSLEQEPNRPIANDCITVSSSSTSCTEHTENETELELASRP